RVPKLHFVLDQERLQLIGLTPEEAEQQLQFLLNGQTIAQVRENIRAVNIVARSAGPERLDPTKLENFTLTTRNGKPIPLSQIGRIEIQSEDPLIKRRDRVPTITVRGDNIETTQPPDVSSGIWAKLAPLRKSLPENYRIEMAGSIEEATKANSALAPLFPIMILFMLAVIIIQVRSFSAMWMVILTALAAVLAFIPLTHSVFWGSMAYVLIGGTAVGTVLTLAFLPALYAIWFRVSDVERHHARESVGARIPLIGSV